MSDNRPAKTDGNSLLDGNFRATIRVQCAPRTLLNLRPVVTSKGKIEEWQLLIGEPPQIDWVAVSNGPKPEPGSPIRTLSVIRFHPEDVQASIDAGEEATNVSRRDEEGKVFPV